MTRFPPDRPPAARSTLSTAERIRRQRVTKGWAFKWWTPAETRAIRAYLTDPAAPAPAKYAHLDKVTPAPTRNTHGRWV
jgi:hypothetical protein